MKLLDKVEISHKISKYVSSWGKKIASFGIAIFLYMVYGKTFARNSNSNFDSDINFYYKLSEELETSASVDLGKEIAQQEIKENSLLNNLTSLFQLDRPAYHEGTGRAIYYVKWILNIALSLVSLVSLILVIYAFYLMFFSKDEEGFGKAKKILRGVVIALAIMGLSRLIVSFFFNTQQTLAP